MWICNCGAVDERRIRRAIANGTTNWKKMCQELRVAQQCGICAKYAKDWFDAEIATLNADPAAYMAKWKD